MSEAFPVIRPLSHATYEHNLDRRVREPEMQANDALYSFVASLSMSRYGEVGEFQARIAYLDIRSPGEAGLLLCLLEPQTEDPLVVLGAASKNGLIEPSDKDRRLIHDPEGNLGKIQEGYLLEAPAELAPRELEHPHSLEWHASDYTDTRTRSFAIDGIFLGSD